MSAQIVSMNVNYTKVNVLTVVMYRFDVTRYEATRQTNHDDHAGRRWSVRRATSGGVRDTRPA